ncbi:MAG TPA: DUF423 domain-containing protein [Phycisphaerae bacterium]|nr:DUF423 domain-containing protein [Phycisphaerae bacterium]
MWFVLTALSGLISVAAGAIGAHWSLSDELRGRFNVGVEYQFYHTLALFLVAWLGARVRSGLVHLAGAAFMLGIILFCGSLYYMGVTGNRSAALVTPYGGMTLMAGWLLLAICGVTWRGRLRPPVPTKP